MLKTVLVSERLKHRGIGGTKKGFPKDGRIRVFGADTETCKGDVFSIQAASQGEETIQYVTPKTAFKSLMMWLEPRCLDVGANLVYFHNLRFDVTVLFKEFQQMIYDQYNEVKLEREGYVIFMFYGRVNVVTIWKDLGGYKCEACGELPDVATKIIGDRRYCANPRHGSPTRVKRNLGNAVKWIDSAAFCPPGAKSLASALKIYGVPYKKMRAPDGLGQRILSDAYFEEYALNDARAVEKLGENILALHKEYDVPPCISLPQLSGKILRRHFFKEGESFQFPPDECRFASELSYHAGKNGLYTERGIYENVIEYDINSAFPKAMREMPQMVKGTYKHVKRYDPRYLGIYRVSGIPTANMRYPLVFDAGFKPCREKFKSEWVTGYEYEILKKCRDYKHLRLREGYIWRHDQNYAHSPLGEFVDKFWELKRTAPKGPRRDTFKNILNSLYGKFAACVKIHNLVETMYGLLEVDEGNANVFNAGSLYHPFIATQITGYVRAELYRLEKKGLALHAATDSIKSFRELKTDDNLGGIKKEVDGRCYLFRNKLYLHFGKDTTLCKHDLDKGWLSVNSEDANLLKEVGPKHATGFRYDAGEDRNVGKLFDWDGQHLCKWGLHGFKGSAFMLYRHSREFLETGHFDYSYQHMVSLREGKIRGETVCDMTRRKEHICLLDSCPNPRENKTRHLALTV